LWWDSSCSFFNKIKNLSITTPNLNSLNLNSANRSKNSNAYLSTNYSNSITYSSSALKRKYLELLKSKRTVNIGNNSNSVNLKIKNQINNNNNSTINDDIEKLLIENDNSFEDHTDISYNSFLNN